MPRTPEPHSVGYQRTDTSREAAETVAPRQMTIQGAVLAALRIHRNLTADEIAHHINRPYGSVRPRLSELREAGIVTDSGERREGRYGVNMVAWRLTTSTERGEA